MKNLSSPRLALSILLFLALFIGITAWFPWTLNTSVKAPGWALASGLDRPFSSPPFLFAVFLLLGNTLACTLERTKSAWTLWKGAIPDRAPVLTVGDDSRSLDFLKNHGFRTAGQPPYFRNRFALTRGWLFHVGLVVLVIGVLLQQARHDNGSFEIAEGEMVRLSEQGIVFDRKSGVFASAGLPDLELALARFDPYLHQEGYAADRASTLVIRTRDGEQQVFLDRAKGVRIEGLSLYQAIPFGLALNIDIPGSGLHSLHLRQQSPRAAGGEFSEPAGGQVLFSVQADRDLKDPHGTGNLRIFLNRQGNIQELQPGQTFLFGGRPARIVSVSHWAGFTYSRSPGIFAVFAGFFLLLAGTAVMLVPAGIAAATADAASGSMRVYLTQSARDFSEDWSRFQNGSDL